MISLAVIFWQLFSKKQQTFAKYFLPEPRIFWYYEEIQSTNLLNNVCKLQIFKIAVRCNRCNISLKPTKGIYRRMLLDWFCAFVFLLAILVLWVLEMLEPFLLSPYCGCVLQEYQNETISITEGAINSKQKVTRWESRVGFRTVKIPIFKLYCTDYAKGLL